MSNPYGDEPYATAWQQGYDFGQTSSGDTPPDFSGWGYEADVTAYLAQVWREGAQAGRDAAAGSSSSSSSDSGGGGGGSDLIQLPADVAAELANLPAYYPESFAIYYAGDAESYLHSIGISDIPSDDEPPAIA
jgi:hypothetical protein